MKKTILPVDDHKSINKFCRQEFSLVNAIRDKHVWIKWMELRVHTEVGAIKGPAGWIPKYEDLKPLFQQVLGSDYSYADYVKQFTLRVPENLARLDRVEEFYRTQVPHAPEVLFDVLAAQRERLLIARGRFGDYIAPRAFLEETANA